ncbi:MAG: hypothetical protein FJ288_05830 [Planctomycetes bacterium]|nr:hypothetical protein [Planctomycetota bacterium]
MTNDARKPAAPSSPWGVVIYPSVHWHVSTTVPREEEQYSQDPFDFGARYSERLLPSDLKRGGVVVIKGERGTFKSTLCRNFLAKGLYDGESVLLISLADRPQLVDPEEYKEQAPRKAQRPPGNRRVAKELIERPPQADRPENRPPKRFLWELLSPVVDEQAKRWSALTRKEKGQIRAWVNPYRKEDKQPAAAGTPDTGRRLLEINFRSGMVLAEEFVQIVRAVLGEQGKDADVRVRRVVLDDVSLIGTSYPLLRKSRTTEDLFLSAFVHIMRNYGVDLVMAGTTGELAAANEAVYRATTLADAVISCRCYNVFGGRYIVVRGEGLMQDLEREAYPQAESVPAVIRWSKSKDERPVFELDLEHLEGLVGFETGEIRRPGVLLYVFSQYKMDLTTDPPPPPPYWRNRPGVHERYNASLQTLIESAFGRPQAGPAEIVVRQPEPEGKERAAARTVWRETGERHPWAPEVSIIRFDSTESEAVHDSLKLLGSGQPVDRTLLYSVDEFWDTRVEFGTPLTSALKLDPEDKPGTEPRQNETDEKAKSERRKEEIAKHTAEHIVLWRGAAVESVRPYYANVLLLAYRRDILLKREGFSGYDEWQTDWLKAARKWAEDVRKWVQESQKDGAPSPPEPHRPPASWRQVKALAEVLRGSQEVKPSGDPCAYPTLPFWFDRSATETLACALMDALIAGGDFKDVKNVSAVRQDFKFAWGDPKERKKLYLREKQDALCKKFIAALKGDRRAQGADNWLTDRQLDELVALTELFHKTGSPDRLRCRLVPDACVYLCWYSQLRDLIDEYPQLADHLAVCALPGGGFTGDWFVGVARGSVSIGLGREVLDILCERAEQYKRFAIGVGLPTLRAFYEGVEREGGNPDFFAWPRGLHVPLERLLQIHLQALSRSFIKDYLYFHTALSTVAFQLTPMAGGGPPSPEVIKRNVERLRGQIQMLSAKSEDEKKKGGGNSK